MTASIVALTCVRKLIDHTSSRCSDVHNCAEEGAFVCRKDPVMVSLSTDRTRPPGRG